MSDTQPRRTQAERRADTERRVVRAAIELIAARGSRAVTLAEVGELAGYSRGIVYQHFGSRENLLAAVVDEAQRFSVPDYAGDALTQLVGIAEAYLVNIEERTPEARAFLQLWGEAIAAEAALVSLFAERDRGFREFLRAVLRHGVRDGTIREGIDVEAGAVLILALLRGTGLQLISSPPAATVAGVMGEVRASLRAAFGSSPGSQES